MKFRAEPKDIIIFVAFCLFLLYLIAIAILNVRYFADEGIFWGLNPFPAFTPEFLVPTVILYLIALIAIIVSVNSYFFDREKGFGILTDKKSKGFSRWAKKDEMKKVLKREMAPSHEFKAAGIPLITDGNELWVDDGEAHSLILGTTGSGKTRRLVEPMIYILGKKGESMIITDPKGELYEGTSSFLKDRGYKIVVINLRDPQKGNAWNPLHLPYQLYQQGNPDKATELLDDLAINILYDESSKNADPFWEKTSADYFAGLALGLFEDTDEDKINLNSINLMTTVGEDRCGASTYIKEYFGLKDPSKPAYINAASTINAPSETKGSILSVFKQKIKLFSSKQNLSEMLSYSDFDLKDIGREKTAVFIVIQDEKKTYHSLATIFVKQCYETLIDVAHQSGGKLPIRTNFILDEFANMPPLKDVTTMITAARSRQIRFNLIIQNFAQLYEVYGEQNGETIKGNCANLIYLLSKELKALEEVSKLCGEVEVSGKDAKQATKPLISVSDLQRLKMGDIIVVKDRRYPFKTKYPDISEYNFAIKKYDKEPFPLRTPREVFLFDLKEFVKHQRNKGLAEMFGDIKETSPRPPLPGFPFDTNSQMRPPMPPFEQEIMPSMPQGMKPPMANGDLDINVDDLIKRIDAKIAKLEEEEKLEQEQMKKPKIDNNVKPLLSNLDGKKPQIDKPIIEATVGEKPFIKEQEETKDKGEEDITDDQFFDDFFLDD